MLLKSNVTWILRPSTLLLKRSNPLSFKDVVVQKPRSLIIPGGLYVEKSLNYQATKFNPHVVNAKDAYVNSHKLITYFILVSHSMSYQVHNMAPPFYISYVIVIVE